MKKLAIAVASMALLATTSAHADLDITVEVDGITEARGNLVVTVFDSDENWLEEPLLTESMAVNSDAKQPHTFRLSLPAGAYAFQVYHDLDSDGEMKTNFIGIPKEPTGVSNAAKGKFGPPKFDDAAVTVDTNNQAIKISLIDI